MAHITDEIRDAAEVYAVQFEHHGPIVAEKSLARIVELARKEADELLRQTLKEADEFAVEIGFQPGELKDTSGLLAKIRAYVAGLTPPNSCTLADKVRSPLTPEDFGVFGEENIKRAKNYAAALVANLTPPNSCTHDCNQGRNCTCGGKDA